MEKLTLLTSKLHLLNKNNSLYVQNFEEMLTQISELNDIRCISLLADFFEDETEFDELMYSIIHLIEQFPDKEYLGAIMAASPKLYMQAPSWTQILYIRILNSPTCGIELKNLMNNNSFALSDEKSIIKQILLDIEAKYPEFQNK